MTGIRTVAYDTVCHVDEVLLTAWVQAGGWKWSAQSWGL